MPDTVSSQLPEYTAPQIDLDGFHCPYPEYGVYRKQTWFHSAALYATENYQGYNVGEDQFSLQDAIAVARFQFGIIQSSSIPLSQRRRIRINDYLKKF